MTFNDQVEAFLDWFIKLPGHRRAPPGLEWTLWKRLPAAFAWFTALPIAVGVLLWLNLSAQSSWIDDGAAMLMIYKLTGLVVFLWTALLTVAIGCVVVMVMKGPAYVADGYDHPGVRKAGD